MTEGSQVKRTSSRMATIARGVLGAVAMTGAVASYFISTWQLQHAPLAPNAGTGEIHPYFIRGTTFYLGSADLAIETWLFPSTAVVGLLASSLLAFAQRSRILS